MSNSAFCNLARVSRLWPPLNSLTPIKSEPVPKSYKHMIYAGIIQQVNAGMYAFLPMGLRALEKLTVIIDREMKNIGAQKILLPALANMDLWKKSNRYKDCQTELLTLKDRHSVEYVLSPTYEEVICDLTSAFGSLSTKILPLKLYQISSKWRDEMKSRYGFLRSKEFTMKDLYTFDKSLDNAQETYNLVCEAYNNIFQQIGVEFVKVAGDSGTIGGTISHEYHYLSNTGEDIIVTCPKCNYHSNKNVCDTSECPECKIQLMEHKGWEVGHAFLLDTKYTKPFKAQYAAEGNQSTPLVMGCFGLGLSRIMAASLETLSTDDTVRWPKAIVPYTVCIIPPKKGSKEEGASIYINDIHKILNRLNVDAILDDRTEYTIGKRISSAKRIGCPYLIVIGKSATETIPLFEIIDVYAASIHKVPLDAIENYFDDNMGNVNINIEASAL